jgi:hypothetical protein
MNNKYCKEFCNDEYRHKIIKHTTMNTIMHSIINSIIYNKFSSNIWFNVSSFAFSSNAFKKQDVATAKTAGANKKNTNVRKNIMFMFMFDFVLIKAENIFSFYSNQKLLSRAYIFLRLGIGLSFFVSIFKIYQKYLDIKFCFESLSCNIFKIFLITFHKYNEFY